MKVKMKYEKETKNTIRFKEVREDQEGQPVFGSLYINKEHLPKGVRSIQVTVDIEN